MERLLRILAAGIVLSAAAAGWAQEKAAPRGAGVAEPARKEPAAPDRKAVARPAANFFTGEVKALDESRGTLTVKSRKGVVKDFIADEKARDQLKNLTGGDKIVVKHNDGTALSIVKPGVKKTPSPEGSVPKDAKVPAVERK